MAQAPLAKRRSKSGVVRKRRMATRTRTVGSTIALAVDQRFISVTLQ
jgi:hypothetical protein